MVTQMDQEAAHRQLGVEGERARIVAWLRSADAPDLDREASVAGRQCAYVLDCADAIERGDHLTRPIAAPAEDVVTTLQAQLADQAATIAGLRERLSTSIQFAGGTSPLNSTSGGISATLRGDTP